MSERDLPVRRGLSIPAGELRESASRAGGPGGQHVNKVSTKVTLRWNPEESAALGPVRRARLRERLAGEGRLLTERGWPYYTLLDVAFQPDCLTVEQLETGFRDVLSRVFSKEATARRIAIRRKIWRRNPALGRSARRQ